MLCDDVDFIRTKASYCQSDAIGLLAIRKNIERGKPVGDLIASAGFQQIKKTIIPHS